MADIGVRGYGNTLEEAFVEGAKALTSVVVDINILKTKQTVTTTCNAPSPELLFVDWLNAIIYEMDVRSMLFKAFQVSIENNTLKGILQGEIVIPAHHHPIVDIKGATYTALKVCEKNGVWLAQCVIDV